MGVAAKVHLTHKPNVPPMENRMTPREKQDADTLALDATRHIARR